MVPGSNTPAGSGQIVLLTKAFEAVAEAIHLDRRDRRWLAALCALVLGIGLLVIVDGRNQSQRNGDMMGVILAVTGCDANDLDACSRLVRDASRAEGTRRTTEVDCLTRRAVAGMPAPEPGRPCAEQTPPEVYPGRSQR